MWHAPEHIPHSWRTYEAHCQLHLPANRRKGFQGRAQAETAQAEGVGRGQGAGQTAGPAEDRWPSVASCTCRQLPG